MIARALTVFVLGCVVVATAHVLRQPAREAAPALLAATAGGGRISLEELRGRRVLVEFFAVWCPECRRDVVRLEELRARYESRGLTVLAVAVEGAPGAVASAVREAGGRYRTGVVDRESAARYGVTRFPTRFLVDADGSIVARNIAIPDVLRAIDP